MVEAPSRSRSADDVDELFEVLSDGRRRVVLEELLERQRPVPVAELVDSVVTAESNGLAPPAERRNGVEVSLHHHHLPKLASSDMIDYDAENRLATVGEAAYAVEPYLELARADARRKRIRR